MKKQVVVKLPDSISKLQSIIHQLYQEINELETKNTSLEEENKELQARLKQNSQNSSKPPSPDGYKKAPAFPGKKEDTKGSSKGHEGNTLLQVKNPDIIKEHEVERCTRDKDLSNSPFPVVETCQVFDLPRSRLMVTSHQIHQTRCPERGRVHKAGAPRGVNAPVQYGNGVKALVTLLNTGYKLPFKKTQTLFTGLFVHSKRGKKALEIEKSHLKSFFGWLVNDCWSSYFHFTRVKHVVCNARILRELQVLIERDCKRVQTFRQFLLNIYEKPFAERLKYKALVEGRYDKICKIAGYIEPPPRQTKPGKGKHERAKGINLRERLVKHEEAVQSFAFESEIPFTNIQAERDVRPAKVKQEIPGCSRAFTGAEIYARVEGFISSARENQLDIFKEPRDTFNGYNYFTPANE